MSHAPTGWNLLNSGEYEIIMTEPLTNIMRWRFVVSGEKPGDDPYGIGPEPRSRIYMRCIASGLQAHGVKVPTPKPALAHMFRSDWIDP